MKYSFYRPHKRVTFDNDLVNPVTGEISYPPSLTKQEFAKECDINNIIKAYQQTGIVKHISEAAQRGQFVDLPDGVDFQDALHLVTQAQEAFMALPAKVRDRFGNDPERFLSFFADPANAKEAEELGLTVPPVVTPPTHVIIDNPPEGGGDGGGTPPS